MKLHYARKLRQWGYMRWVVVVRFAITIWVFVGLIAGAPVSWADCPKNLAKLAASAETTPEVSFPKWSIKEQNLKLKTEQLFPEKFIREVEDKVGSIVMQISFLSRVPGVKIQGVVKNQVYFTVSLFENSDYPGKVLIDQLRLENPIENKKETKLNLEQRAKGLPPEVFRHVQKRLFELAKAGGYDQVFTNSQQHFAVAMLYKKIVGMEPAPGNGEKLYAELESLYAFARRELPEDLRPKDVQEFTSWLGTFTSWPTGYKGDRAKKLEHYFKTGELDPTIQIFKDKDNKPVCALFTDDNGAESRLLFIYHHFGEPRIIKWIDIAKSFHLGFIKKL